MSNVPHIKIHIYELDLQKLTTNTEINNHTKKFNDKKAIIKFKLKIKVTSLRSKNAL